MTEGVGIGGVGQPGGLRLLDRSLIAGDSGGQLVIGHRHLAHRMALGLLEAVTLLGLPALGEADAV